jgi:hydroxymethylbilane synthase
VPIGALSSVVDGVLHLRGVVLPPDGSQRVAVDIKGPMAEAEVLGQTLAQELRSAGAEEMLRSV